MPEDYTEMQRLLLPTAQEVRPTQPSPAINPPMQMTVTPCRRTCNSSTSSSESRNLDSPDDAPPAMCTRSHTHSNASANSTPSSRIILPQVTFQPLPVLQEGEGLEVDRSEINTNEGITVNFVDGDSSWTFVQRRKKKKVKKDNKSEKWNGQQKENFICFSDIYQGVPYKSYRNVDIRPPVTNIPLQQPVIQQPVAPPPPIAAAPAQQQIIPPASVAAAAASLLPIPLIVITPPLRPITPSGRKHPRLQAIPEEDEDDSPEPQRMKFQSSSSSSSSLDEFNTHSETPAARPGGPRRPRFGSEDLPSAFGSLALSLDANLQERKDKIPIGTRGEGAAKVSGASKPLQHFLAEAGPPSQKTRQMEKELEKTLLKRYKEAKMLEK
jgi:hypothetical protein